MTMPLALLLAMVVLYAIGVYLLLDRSLTRVLLGFLLVGNATNLLLFLTSGSFGAAPIYGETEPEDMSDPLPQAFILTSIVITFGVSAFILALIYRAWRLTTDGEDEVQDDEHDTTLTSAESLTTEEVTDEELASTPEFEDDEDDEEHDEIAADRSGNGGTGGGDRS
ncbi:Na(+)/H(+) antiporter subunit C [Leucobacter soli]|uniref:Na(+) H(+) antiporter subunit C n=1 Tax=Leucobacter soli TaxID=2812850 RepID=A0A916NL03_9MICO|nr:Na(+)/H(+) antiporter subunit C [Leucobacter soli]CAG7597218.1 hypothetical protein LEUCIP111803_00133 [Leucobacter soli]